MNNIKKWLIQPLFLCIKLEEYISTDYNAAVAG